MPLFRLIKILHTVGRYRLDNLLRNQVDSRSIGLLLIIFRLYPTCKLKRGQALRLAFEELGPIFIKFGQLLSTRPDLLPSDIVEELDKLQDKVPSFDGNLAQSIVEKALDGSVDDLFKEFEKEAFASASVAQVHAATLHSGHKIVLKVIRPHIENVIEQDVKLMHLLARIIEKFTSDGKRLRPVEVVEDYRNTIFDELNLMREAANASQLKRNFSGARYRRLLYVPEVYWEFTRQNVMAMERIDGIQVTDLKALKAQNTNLELLAKRGVETFFTQVFEHNFFHADMHPGNVFVAREKPEDPYYMAVDMAIVGSLTREDQYYLARNLLAMFRRDYKQVAELHVQSGWVPHSTSVSEFESAIRTVCEPIFEKPLKDISFGQALITLFRTARRFNMPIQPQLVLLQKTLLNIEGLGRQLYPELNLWDTAHPYLEKWIRDRFHPRTLWKEFKYYSPEWMEKFPEVPQLIFDTLSEVKSLAHSAPEIREAAKLLAKEKIAQQKRLKRFVIALPLFGAAVVTGFASLSTLPIVSLSLGIAGIVLLIW